MLKRFDDYVKFMNEVAPGDFEKPNFFQRNFSSKPKSEQEMTLKLLNNLQSYIKMQADSKNLENAVVNKNYSLLTTPEKALLQVVRSMVASKLGGQVLVSEGQIEAILNSMDKSLLPSNDKSPEALAAYLGQIAHNVGAVVSYEHYFYEKVKDHHRQIINTRRQGQWQQQKLGRKSPAFLGREIAGRIESSLTKMLVDDVQSIINQANKNKDGASAQFLIQFLSGLSTPIKP